MSKHTRTHLKAHSKSGRLIGHLMAPIIPDTFSCEAN